MARKSPSGMAPQAPHKQHGSSTRRVRCTAMAPQVPSTPLLLPYNASEHSGRLAWTHKNVTTQRRVSALCATSQSASGSQARHDRVERTSCAQFVAQPALRAVRLLVGVMTGPLNRERRDAIRRTWMKQPTVGMSAVVCFVIGRHQVSDETLARLDAEASLHHDLLFLPISDGCVKQVSIGKLHSFWVEAARLLRGVDGTEAPLVAKVDDDSFVNLPLLEASVHPLRCVRRLYYGAVGFTGYLPVGFKNCGFAWSGGGSYAKYGCERVGAHPPFPFVLGQLQVLS